MTSIRQRARNPVILGLIELERQAAKKKPAKEEETEPLPVKGKRAPGKKERK